MATVASSARGVNDVHYTLLRPPSVPLVLMTSRVDVILLVVGTLHMTSHFSLLTPYPTERLHVILHQNGGMILTGENRSTVIQICSNATLSTTNSTWTDPASNTNRSVLWTGVYLNYIYIT
jgi:hypothetical protein